MNFNITESNGNPECPKSFYAEKTVGYDWHSECEGGKGKVSGYTNFGICECNGPLDIDPVRETQQNIQNWLEHQKQKDMGIWVHNPKEYKYRSNYDI